MKSNVECWKSMQDHGYFDNHRCYRDRDAAGDYDLRQIERFVPLKPTDTVVVIGCGYGRETAHIAPRVKRVFGIDVSHTILSQTIAYVRARGILNFVPVLAEEYAEVIPDGIDLVYSLVTFQHLTRDLANDYLLTLGKKLAPDGRMVLQYLESENGQDDAEIREYEPSVSWTPTQITWAANDAGLKVIDLVTDMHPRCFYHWAHLGRL
jgi:cyclopropane fatty-acyl-phospholipid synthase-like methyltransferase